MADTSPNTIRFTYNFFGRQHQYEDDNHNILKTMVNRTGYKKPHLFCANKNDEEYVTIPLSDNQINTLIEKLNSVTSSGKKIKLPWLEATFSAEYDIGKKISPLQAECRKLISQRSP